MKKNKMKMKERRKEDKNEGRKKKIGKKEDTLERKWGKEGESRNEVNEGRKKEKNVKWKTGCKEGKSKYYNERKNKEI